MPLQSCKIGCMYKTPFANLVTYILASVPTLSCRCMHTLDYLDCCISLVYLVCFCLGMVLCIYLVYLHAYMHGYSYLQSSMLIAFFAYLIYYAYLQLVWLLPIVVAYTQLAYELVCYTHLQLHALSGVHAYQVCYAQVPF